MINERMSNNEISTNQPPHNVAWEGDVYSQVLGNEKSGYVRGLGLGQTPSFLWGRKSSIKNIVVEDSSNEFVQRLEQEIIELKEKQNEEMDLMKQNHEKLQLELLQMRQFMQKYAPNESLPQDINVTSNEQVPNHNSGQGVPQSSRISSNAEITLPPSTNHLYHLMLFFEFSLLVFLVFIFNRSVHQLNSQFVVVVFVVLLQV